MQFRRCCGYHFPTALLPNWITRCLCAPGLKFGLLEDAQNNYCPLLWKFGQILPYVCWTHASFSFWITARFLCSGFFLRCVSAAGYRDAYLGSGEAFIPPLSSLSHRSMFSEHPASLGSGSMTIPGSLDGELQLLIYDYFYIFICTIS